MTQYLVRWEIDIEADGPQEAAEKALAIYRNPDSIATVFDVYDQSRGGKIPVDLTPDRSKDMPDGAYQNRRQRHKRRLMKHLT